MGYQCLRNTETCMNATNEMTTEHPGATPAAIEPEFIRLPAPGTLCPYTGMARSALNEVILPTPRNDGRPPVKSFCLRKRGARTGIRLIEYRSLCAYIRAHAEPTVRG
jgi:hypothetical protein